MCFPIKAQDEMLTLASCDDLQNISTIPTVMNICNDYRGCAFTDTGMECYYNTFLKIVEACEAFKLDSCIESAIVHMDVFPAIIGNQNSFKQSAYVALSVFESDSILREELPVGQYRTNFPVTYAMIWSSLNEYEIASDLLDDALRRYPTNSVVWYFSGLLHITNNNRARAEFDFYTYRQLAPTAILDVLLPTETPNDIQMQTQAWVQYPMLSTGSSPGGMWIRDESLGGSTDITIEFTENRENFAIFGLTNGLGEPEDALYFVWDSYLNVYTANDLRNNPNRAFYYSEDQDYDEFFQATLYDDYLVLKIVSESFEAGGHNFHVLMPADAPNPHDALYYPCEGLNQSWIEVGDELILTTERAGFAIRLYESPDPPTDDIGIALSDFYGANGYSPMIVTGEPHCGTEVIWWEVTLGDSKYWIRNSSLALPEDVFTNLLNARELTLAQMQGDWSDDG